MGSELEKLLIILDNKLNLLPLLIPLIALSLLLSLSQRITRAFSNRLEAIMPVVTVAFVLIYAANAFHYVFFAGYYDHVEPSVVTIVGLLDKGQPVYHDVSSASRYSLQYGPNAFIVPWLAAKVLGNPVISIKLLGALFTAAAVGLFYAVVRTSVESRFARQAALIYFCGASLVYSNVLVWIRSDSQMLFWVALGLWGAMRKNAILAFALMGAAAGACLNTKVHGVLYFIPIIALATKRSRWAYWGVFAVATAVMAVAPFLLFPEVSFPNYILWLKMAVKHGFGVVPAINVFVVFGCMCMPLGLAAFNRLSALAPEERRKLLLENRSRLAIAAIGVGLLLLAASKKGAGGWHLLPLVSLGGWLLAVLLDAKKQGSVFSLQGVSAIIMTALLALAACNAALVLIKVSSVYDGSAYEPLRAVMADAKDIAQRFPGKTMAVGFGSDQTYPMTYARTALPVETGLVLDPAALMDMSLSGLALPQATLDALREGLVQVWLVPKGDVPFSMRDTYQRQDLFGPQFRQVFNDHYKRIDQSPYFDVWCFDQ